MKLKQCLFSAVVACGLFVSPVFALVIGDNAPALQISEWVKGEPVNLADGNESTTYVVEFWAT